jgi:hypothetical protein
MLPALVWFPGPAIVFPERCEIDGRRGASWIRWAEGVAVWEQGDVGRPLPNQQRVLDSVRRRSVAVNPRGIRRPTTRQAGA